MLVGWEGGCAHLLALSEALRRAHASAQLVVAPLSHARVTHAHLVASDERRRGGAEEPHATGLARLLRRVAEVVWLAPHVALVAHLGADPLAVRVVRVREVAAEAAAAGQLLPQVLVRLDVGVVSRRAWCAWWVVDGAQQILGRARDDRRGVRGFENGACARTPSTRMPSQSERLASATIAALRSMTPVALSQAELSEDKFRFLSFLLPLNSDYH